MSENWINIYNLCYSTVVLKKKLVKLLKIAPSALVRQKHGQYRSHQKQSSFFLERTKGDHKL